MKGKEDTLIALEGFRRSILGGGRAGISSTFRQHLERGSPLVSDVAFDQKHAPLSTNVSRHFRRIRTLAKDSLVRHHAVLPLKRASAQKLGPAALLVIIDSKSRLALHSIEGEALLTDFDVGHADGRVVTHLALSPSQESHFILTADDLGNMRVHNLKVVARKEPAPQAEDADASSDEPVGHALKKTHVVVHTNFSCAFSLPRNEGGEPRILNTVLPIERGTQTYFVTGDSLGGVAVFFRNGTIKGRTKVSEDPGGVRGLLRGQGQTILFFASHAFGFLSISNIDVQYPPCSGWNSPLFNIAFDPSSSYSRVLLALEDGDVLVYATTRGKSKVCDLTLKFPRVSPIPFKLFVFRGHAMALPTPLDTMKRADEYHRELFFFNLASLEEGYGSAPSGVVGVQASFRPRQPAQCALHMVAGSGAGASKVQLALRFLDEPGVELYDLNLKQAPTPAKAMADGSGGWLDYFPKVGVMGIALVGIVVWNVRKVAGGGSGDFDADSFKERFKNQLEKEEHGRSLGGGLGGGVDLDSDD